jgi:heptosyltransferase-3
MHFSGKLQRIRRALTRKMTRNLGITRIPLPSDVTAPQKLQTVLICRPNHRLGNLLLITPLLQEVQETLPDARVDLFVKGTIAPVLFKNYKNVNRIIQLPKKPLKNIFKYLRAWMIINKNPYDLVINVVNHSSSGKMSAQFANSKFKFMGDIDEQIRLGYSDHLHIAKYPVYSFRHYIGKLGFETSKGAVPELDLKLSEDEIAEGHVAVRDLVKNEKRTICLYTYATGAKRHSPAWWETFYERLKVQFPDSNIIEVLPIENVSQISFRAPSLYSRDLRNIASFIANTQVFIGADSGMMHLASAARIPTVGLFKADNMPVYAPFNHRSLAINTDTTDIEGLIRIVDSILYA